MSDNFDYLSVDTEDKNVLKNLSTMGEHLKELKLKVLEAEAELKKAKAEHDHYASSILPMEMFNAGVTSLTLMSGGTMQYERKFYCQPNKNASDREIMAEWLRSQGGGHLVKEKASVEGGQIEFLREHDIPFTEVNDLNTNSLKAFLKDKIGASGGVAQIQISDIPECMHFQEVGIVNIEA